MVFLDIKTSIIDEMKRVGIDVQGFASCSPFIEVLEILKDREAKGFLSGFEEKEIEKRVNPKYLMDDCKTIISAGISYNVDTSSMKQEESMKYKCIISKASWGQDYHNVLKSKLKEVSNFIENNYNGKALVFVDTGPLVEREIARRAGIGFIGKNCSIINPEFGSFVFIGEILTNIYIEPDSPLEDGCGDCNICIKACPSGALCAPYTLDAKKCISFMTQDKNMSFEHNGKFKSSIYGCDICQNVCPKNKGANISSHSEFMPEEWNSYPDAIDILNMDSSTYKDTFRKTSSGWRGRTILQRNAIFTLGCSGNRDMAVYIKKMLGDSRKEIRRAAVFAIYNLLHKDSSSILNEHIVNEQDNDIRCIIKEFLDRM